MVLWDTARTIDYYSFHFKNVLASNHELNKNAMNGVPFVTMFLPVPS
jgi:hypothetical protein